MTFLRARHRQSAAESRLLRFGARGPDIPDTFPSGALIDRTRGLGGIEANRAVLAAVRNRTDRYPSGYYYWRESDFPNRASFGPYALSVTGGYRPYAAMRAPVMPYSTLSMYNPGSPYYTGYSRGYGYGYGGGLDYRPAYGSLPIAARPVIYSTVPLNETYMPFGPRRRAPVLPASSIRNNYPNGLIGFNPALVYNLPYVERTSVTTPRSGPPPTRRDLEPGKNMLDALDRGRNAVTAAIDAADRLPPATAGLETVPEDIPEAQIQAKMKAVRAARGVIADLLPRVRGAADNGSIRVFTVHLARARGMEIQLMRDQRRMGMVLLGLHRADMRNLRAEIAASAGIPGAEAILKRINEKIEGIEKGVRDLQGEVDGMRDQIDRLENGGTL